MPRRARAFLLFLARFARAFLLSIKKLIFAWQGSIAASMHAKCSLLLASHAGRASLTRNVLAALRVAASARPSRIFWRNFARGRARFFLPLRASRACFFLVAKGGFEFDRAASPPPCMPHGC